MNWTRQGLAGLVSGALVLANAPPVSADEVEQSMTQPAAPQVAETAIGLDQLVAPIALYPDTLIAQVLAASTYPDEVVEADRWLQQNPGLTCDTLAQAVDQLTWDPSVKALTQFPLILANMDKNLSWTSSLGNAYASSPQDVLNAVQVMRQRAEQAGYLASTWQETVTTEGPTITIQPTDANTVYVPEYDPWSVYGAPVGEYPGWVPEPGLFVSEPEVLFGLGIGIAAFAGFGWGWHHWGADWRSRSVVFDHNTYVSHRRVFANRNSFYDAHTAFAYPGGYGRGAWHGPVTMRYGNYNGFNRGGAVRSFAFHGRPAFGGGFHVATGGFHGGGFHGGGHR